MTFGDATRRFQVLRGEFQAGQLSREQFSQAVDELRVEDGGRWWQMDVTGGWRMWNGANWVQATPPGQTPGTVAAGPPSWSDLAEKSGIDPHAVQESWQNLQGYVFKPENFMQETKKPLLQRSQLWWDALSVFGGAVSGVLWFFYSSIRGFTREGLDLTTPIIMVLIPLTLAIFRSRIDELLLPLQPYRRKAPRLVLIGAGLFAPFVVAQILYVFFKQYTYLHVTLIMGTLVSYMILRTPQITADVRQNWTGRRTP